MPFVLRRLLLLIVAAGVVASCAAAKPTEGTVTTMDFAGLPPHPRLLLNSKGIAEMKERIKSCDWARERWVACLATADDDLAKEIVLPPRGGNWGHWYACPEHGCNLSTGKQIGEWQWEHKCPIGGEIMKSDPTKASKDYDGCRINHIHHEYTSTVLAMGIAYQMTGDVRYANKARDIALAYAQKYPTYPIHNNQGEPKLGSKVGSQNLDESTWMIPLCQGLDLVWKTLTQAERQKITNELLLPSAKEVLMPTPHGIHNIQCWRNSAIGLVGFLVGDNELIEFAINNPGTGFRSQMEKGVSPDGCWFEGAWGYHFYTMSATWPLTEAARNCATDLYCPEFKRMFEAPIKFAMPIMALPAFNDSGQSGLSGANGLYELAYARYKDPILLDLLSRSTRRNDFAMWFGEAKLPEAGKREWKSANYPKSGYAILARGEGEKATWLGLKYGPHGGGHGHPDKLNFVLCAKGHVVGYDPGTTKYGLPLQKEWHKTTIAHNTLTIDEESQKPAEGRCIAFGSEKGVDYAVCDAGPIYDGVSFTRTTAMLDENLIVFVDQVRSDKEHTYDMAYHQRGKWAIVDGTAWTPPDKKGYMHIKDAVSWKTGDGAELRCDVSDVFPVSIQLAAGEPTEVIAATGVGSNQTDRVPVVIFRRQAKDTVYVWSVSLDGQPAKIERLKSRAGVEVKVTSAAGKKWTLVANPDTSPAFSVK